MIDAALDAVRPAASAKEIAHGGGPKLAVVALTAYGTEENQVVLRRFLDPAPFRPIT